jgi:hypothetical protein
LLNLENVISKKKLTPKFSGKRNKDITNRLIGVKVSNSNKIIEKINNKKNNT